MASSPCSPSRAAAAGVGRGPRSAAGSGSGSSKKLTCLCSPTNHPGSFRCIRHRNGPRGPAAPSGGGGEARPGPSRGRAAKGRSVRALLLQRISSCPSDRNRQRRLSAGDFQPRPSRLRLMNM